MYSSMTLSNVTCGNRAYTQPNTSIPAAVYFCSPSSPYQMLFLSHWSLSEAAPTTPSITRLLDLVQNLFPNRNFALSKQNETCAHVCRQRSSIMSVSQEQVKKFTLLVNYGQLLTGTYSCWNCLLATQHFLEHLQQLQPPSFAKNPSAQRLKVW